MQEGTMDPKDALGVLLCLELDCSLRLGPTGRIFLCHHNVMFSITRLYESDDWAWAVEKHNEELLKRGEL